MTLKVFSWDVVFHKNSSSHKTTVFDLKIEYMIQLQANIQVITLNNEIDLKNMFKSKISK